MDGDTVRCHGWWKEAEGPSGRLEPWAPPSGQPAPCPWTHLLWRKPRTPHSCPGPEARGSCWATSRRPQRPQAAPLQDPVRSARQRSHPMPSGLPLRGQSEVGPGALLLLREPGSLLYGLECDSHAPHGACPDAGRGQAGVSLLPTVHPASSPLNLPHPSFQWNCGLQSPKDREERNTRVP